MRRIRQLRITRTERTTINVLRVPGPADRQPGPTASQMPGRWRQLLSLLGEWMRRNPRGR